MHETDGFEGAGGVALHSQRWLPATDPRAVLVIVHGFGEHSGRYASFVESLVASGIAVHSYDQRGHGQSPGQRGHICGMSDYREDLGAFVAGVSAHHRDTPVFLWGHSMGSVVVLDYALRHPESLRAVITSGVGLEPAGVATRTVVTTARLFSKIWPTFRMALPLDASQLTRDPAVVQDYVADRLVHNNASARLAVSLLDAVDWIKQNAKDLQLPLLMIHGGSDQINLPAGSENFIGAVEQPDKKLIIYPDNRHEPHNDFARDRMITDLTEWVLTRA